MVAADAAAVVVAVDVAAADAAAADATAVDEAASDAVAAADDVVPHLLAEQSRGDGGGGGGTGWATGATGGRIVTVASDKPICIREIIFQHTMAR